MNNKFKILVLFLTFAGWNICSLADDVLATFGKDQKLTLDQMEKWYKSVDFANNVPGAKKTFGELEKPVKEELARQYITQQQLINKAETSGIEKTKEFKEKLEEIKKSLLINSFIEEKIAKEVTEKALKKEYDDFVKLMKDADEIEVSHIMLNDKDKANDVYKEFKKGAKFGDLAKKYSEDNNTKDKGGKVGILTRGNTTPKYEEAMYKLKKGDVSKPVETEFGWYIIKADNRKARKIPEMKDVKSQLEIELKQKLTQEYIEKFRDGLNIKFKD